MKIFGKKKIEDSQNSTQTPREAPQNVRGSSWTKGRELMAKGITAGLLTLIVTGGVGGGGFFLYYFGQDPDAATAATAVEVEDHDAAGAYALEFVAAWMNASKDEPGELGSYITVDDLDLSEKPWAYRDLSVVQIEESADPFVTVTVSANVLETTFDDDGDSSEVWPRRYFQVAVAEDASGLSVAALPSPITAPSTGDDIALGYPEQVVSSSEIGSTVMEFLGAYLAGAGDLTRFIAPDADITPITPAPFVQVEARELTANRLIEGSPREGEQLSMLATTRVVNTDSRTLTATYALTLTARAGRWEISAIERSPVTREQQTAVSSAPTPAVTESPALTEQ